MQTGNVICKRSADVPIRAINPSVHLNSDDMNVAWRTGKSKDKFSPLQTRTVTLITLQKACVEVFTATIELKRIPDSFWTPLPRKRGSSVLNMDLDP